MRRSANSRRSSTSTSRPDADEPERGLRRALEPIVAKRPAAAVVDSSAPIGDVEGESVMEAVSPWPGEVGMVEIKRPVYSQHNFANVFSDAAALSFVDTIFVPRSPPRSWRQRLLQLLPLVSLLRDYRPREWLLPDLLSGASTGITRIPQSMAYALLAYVSPVYGLYTALVSGLVYSALGTSPHLVMSCQGVASLMTGQAAKRFAERRLLAAGGNRSLNGSHQLPSEFVELASDKLLEAVVLISLLVGLFQLLLGCLRLGMITNYLSDPLIGGFTTGAAVEVVCSQISAVVGFEVPVPKDAPPEGVFDNFKIVYYALLNVASFSVGSVALSACSVVFLVAAKAANAKLHERRCRKLPIPGELILVLVATLLSEAIDFEELGIAQVGEVPRGFETPRVPQLQLADAALLQETLVLAVVAFAIALSVAKKFALQYDTEIDANQEFLAYGAANVAGSFSNCFVATSSMSCSALHESLGGRTQVANVFASLLVLVTILFLGPSFAATPTCVLSAIILVNLKTMLWQFGDLPQLWSVSKIDFLLWIVTFVSVFCFSVDTGLVVGVAFSLMTIVFRSQWPYACVLGRIPHTDIYKNILVTPDAKEVGGVKIFRYEGSLYFASADHFRASLYLLTDCNPRQLAIRQQAYDRKLRSLRLTVEEAIPVLPASTEAAAAPLLEASDKATNYGSVASASGVADLRPTTSLHHVVIDFSCCSFIDSVGMRMLQQVLNDYTEAGVTVFLSNTRAAVRSMLTKAKISHVDTKKLFLSNHDAVSAALSEAHKVEEKNWLHFDSIARQRMSIVKQHWVSRLPSEIDEAEDFEEVEDTVGLLSSGAEQRSSFRCDTEV